MFKDSSYLQLWRQFGSTEWNHLCNFDRGHYGEHSCEIILNWDELFRRRWCLKIVLFYSSGGHFVRQSWTICAILIEGIMGTFMWNYFKLWGVVQKQMAFKNSFYLQLWRPFRSAEQNHHEPQISYFVNFTQCEELVQYVTFGNVKYVQSILTMFGVKQILTSVKNWYKIITCKKNWF